MDQTPLINTDESLLHRFLRYVEFDTQSDEDSGTSPSTAIRSPSPGIRPSHPSPEKTACAAMRPPVDV